MIFSHVGTIQGSGAKNLSSHFSSPWRYSGCCVSLFKASWRMHVLHASQTFVNSNVCTSLLVEEACRIPHREVFDASALQAGFLIGRHGSIQSTVDLTLDCRASSVGFRIVDMCIDDHRCTEVIHVTWNDYFPCNFLCSHWGICEENRWLERAAIIHLK
jgi:hypothetical protein